MTFQLLLLNRTQGADERRKRGLLYLLAFCLLALVAVWGPLLVQRPDSGQENSLILLRVLALLSGTMALWIRMSGEAKAAGETAAPKRPQESKSLDGLWKFAEWRSARADKFDEFHASAGTALPPERPIEAPLKQTAGRSKRVAKAEKPHDPFAKALEEFDNRSEGGRRRN